MPGRAVSVVAPPGPDEVTGFRCGLDETRVMQMRSALAQRRLAGNGSTGTVNLLPRERVRWGVATDSIASALRIPRRPWLPEHRAPQ